MSGGVTNACSRSTKSTCGLFCIHDEKEEYTKEEKEEASHNFYPIEGILYIYTVVRLINYHTV